MAIPAGPVPTFPSRGLALQDGRALNRLSALLGSTCSITAKAAGVKANATPITGVKCLINVCVTNGDSALLPPGYPGLEVEIFNKGAANAQIFGSGNDTIDAANAATGVTQNAGKTATYTCFNVVAGVGIWGRNLSA